MLSSARSHAQAEAELPLLGVLLLMLPPVRGAEEWPMGVRCCCCCFRFSVVSTLLGVPTQSAAGVEPLGRGVLVDFTFTDGGGAGLRGLLGPHMELMELSSSSDIVNLSARRSKATLPAAPCPHTSNHQYSACRSGSNVSPNLATLVNNCRWPTVALQNLVK